MKDSQPVPRIEIGGVGCQLNGCDWRRGFLLVVTGDTTKDAAERGRQSKLLTRAVQRHMRTAHGGRYGRLLLTPKGERAPPGWHRVKPHARHRSAP